MKPHAVYWLVAAFVISFFAVGFPYRQIPYQKVPLPSTLHGTSLLVVGVLAARSLDALLKYASGSRGSVCPSRTRLRDFATNRNE